MTVQFIPSILMLINFSGLSFEMLPWTYFYKLSRFTCYLKSCSSDYSKKESEITAFLKSNIHYLKLKFDEVSGGGGGYRCTRPK